MGPGSAAEEGHGRRNLLAMWPGLFVVSMGLMSVLPTLPLYIEERFRITDPTSLQNWSSVIFGAAPLAAGLVGPIWGGLGDRVGRKPMVVRAMVSIAIITGLMPLASSPWALLVMRVLQGMFAGYIAPAMALVSASSSERDQGRAIARMQVALALGMFCGPLLGAELSVWAGRESVFYACGVLALLAALIAAIVAREDRNLLERRPDDLSWLGDLLAQTRDMLRNGTFAWLLALILLMRFGQNMAEPFLALFVRGIGPLDWLTVSDPEHAVDRTTAIAFVVLAVAQILMTPLWGRAGDRFGPLLCLAIAALCLGGLLFGSAEAGSSGEFLFWRALAAMCMAGTMTLAYAAASKRVPPTRRSMAFSMIQSGTQLGLALGPIVGGWFVSELALTRELGTEQPVDDLRWLFRFAAIATLLSGIGMILLRTRPSGKLDAPILPVPDERE